MTSVATAGGSGLVFVSHASADASLARRLVEDVLGAGYEQVFFTSQPELGIAPGDQWEPSLYQHLRRASLVLFVLTRASLASPWCFAELAFARALERPIFTLRAPGAPLHPLASDAQAVAIDEPGFAARLADVLARHLGRPGTRWPEGRCPFPGLDRFTSELEPVFVGRDEAVEEVLALFSPLRRQGARRVVAVTGPSGSGKSSFVLAGVVPRLARLPGWTVLPPVVPGADPMGNLAGAAAGVLGPDLAATTSVDGAVVVVVDQFEEVVTLADSGARRAFLATLDRLATGPAPVWVLLTVRAEFVSRSAEPNPIAELLATRAAVHLLLPLGRDPQVVREVVAVPAARAGADVEPALLDRIVDDVSGGDVAGASLPLLALALRETWVAMEDRRRGTAGRRVLTVADYESSGGIAEVVVRLAGTAASRLALEGCAGAVLPTLVRFVAPSEVSERPTRRRVAVAALAGCAARVAEEFQRARLLRVVEADGRPAYEVTHEALFEDWAELGGYIREHWTMLRDLAEVERRARAWVAAGSPGDDLLRGPLLERISAFPERPADDLVASYLDASVAADRQARGTLARARAAAEAETALNEVGVRPDRALERVLAAVAPWAAAAAPAGGAAGAAGDDPPPALQEALYAVACTARQRRREEAHHGSVRAVAAGGGLIASGGDDRRVRLWPAGGGAARSTAALPAGVDALAFGDGDRLLAIALADGSLLCWDLAEPGEAPRSLAAVAPDVVTALCFFPAGDRLAGVSEAGVLRVWDVASGTVEDEVEAHPDFATACAVDAAGTSVFTAGGDGTVARWRAAPLAPSGRAVAHDGAAFALALDRSGQRLSTAGLDGLVRLWTADLRPVGRPWEGHGRYVAAVAFSPSGRAVVSAGGDGTVRQWDLDGRPCEPPLVGHEEAVCAVAAAGGTIVTGGVDGTVRWWDEPGRQVAAPVVGRPEPVSAVLFATDDVVLCAWDSAVHRFSASGAEDGEPWVGHESYVWALAVNARTGTVATASADATVRVWDLAGRPRAAPLAGHQADVTNVAFIPDGSAVVSGGSDGTVRLWPLADGGRHTVLGRHDGQVNVVLVVDRAGTPVVVSGGNDGMLRLWALDGARLGEVHAHDGPVRYAAGRGAAALTVGEEGQIHGFDLEGLTPRFRPVAAHDGPIAMIVAAPGGFVTAGWDGLLRRWTEEAAPFGPPLLAHAGGAWAVAVSPSGHALVTGGQDGAVRFWRGGTWRAWLAAARARTGGATGQDLAGGGIV